MRRAVATLLTVLCAAALSAEGLDVNGSVEDATYVLHDVTAGSFSYAGYIRPTVTLRTTDSDNARFEMEASLTLLYGQYADAYLAPVLAMGLGSVPALDAAVAFDVRKLFLSLYLGPVDLTLGRRIVNWGYGRVFSPTDAYSSPDLTDISLRRTGSDVIMAEASFNDVSGAALILSPTTDMEGYKAGAKVFTNLLGFDGSLVGIYKDTDTDLLLGAALKGSVPPLDIGLTLEAVRHILRWGDDGWYEAMVGLDYSFFDGDLIVLAEYLYNERSIDASELTAAQLAAVERTFFGHHYAFASAQAKISETVYASASLLANVETLAAIAAVQLTFAIFDAASVTASVRALSDDINSIPGNTGLRLSYGLTVKLSF